MPFDRIYRIDWIFLSSLTELRKGVSHEEVLLALQCTHAFGEGFGYIQVEPKETLLGFLRKGRR
jgi:hypothetical protein